MQKSVETRASRSVTNHRKRKVALTDEAAQWFAANRAEMLSDDQRRAFATWLRAAPDHMGEYLAFAALAEDLESTLRHSPIDTADMLDSAAQAVDTSDITFLSDVRGTSPRPPSAADSEELLPQRRPWARRVLVAGAAAATVAISVGLWWQYSNTNFSTGRGEQRSWPLPDGTMVHLNSSTRIKVSFDAKERRVFVLQGQATFHVAKDQVHPFVVRAGDAVVRAVGTEFDVYRLSDAETLVSVIEGRVAVADSAVTDANILTSQPLFLDIGQQANVKPGHAVLADGHNTASRTVAWLQNKVAFDHDTLAYASQQLNRYNDIQLTPENNEAASLLISGTFGAYDAESFVKFLERQPGVKIAKQGREIRITSVVRSQ
jgi:transmembrane sensor